MIPQEVHDAGLAGSSRCGEHHVPGAQRLPQLRHECRAEPQVNRVDGSAGVEFGGALRFHVNLVVKQISCRNNYTTILMYVNCVVEMQRGSRTGPALPLAHEPAPFPVLIRSSADLDAEVGGEVRARWGVQAPSPLQEGPGKVPGFLLGGDDPVVGNGAPIPYSGMAHRLVTLHSNPANSSTPSPVCLMIARNVPLSNSLWSGTTT